MDQTTGYDSGGGTPDPAPKPTEDPKPTVEPKNDFGYDDPKPTEDPKPDDKPTEDPKPDPDPEPKEIPKSTGYDEVPPKKDEPAPAKPEDDPKPDEIVLENAEKLLPEESKFIKDLAKEHKLGPEVVKALVEQKNLQIAADQKLSDDADTKRKEGGDDLKRKWHQELKDDKDFGGENFKVSIKKVDKIIDEHMPNLKKELTEGGGMLPPSLMRDLAKIADRLHSTEKLVSGDPKTPDKKGEEEENNPLDFYE